MSIDAVGTVDQKQQKSPLLYGAGGAAAGLAAAGGTAYFLKNPLRGEEKDVFERVVNAATSVENTRTQTAIGGLKGLIEGEAGKETRKALEGDAAKKAKELLESVGLGEGSSASEIAQKMNILGKASGEKGLSYSGLLDEITGLTKEKLGKDGVVDALKKKVKDNAGILGITDELDTDKKVVKSAADKIEDFFTVAKEGGGREARSLDDVIASVQGLNKGEFSEVAQEASKAKKAGAKTAEEIFDKGKKEFKELGDKAGQGLKDAQASVKKAFKDIKLKAALKWGAIGAAAVGIVAALVISSKNKKAAAEAQAQAPAPAPETPETAKKA